MTTVADLSLTPAQQLEVEQVDPRFRDAWLTELDQNRRTVKNPVAWFLSALRTGRMPTAAPQDMKGARDAETWIRNAGYLLADQDIVEAFLFDQLGYAKGCDATTRERLLELWRTLAAQRPDPENSEPAPFEHADNDIDWSTP